MTLSEPDSVQARAALLTEEWRAASLSSVWTRAGDWHGPAVDALAHALAAQDDAAASAAAELGVERATKGVSLTEGLDDLALVYRLAGAGELPYGQSRAFAHAWAEIVASSLQARGSIDSLTGLATSDYLVVRLREVYAESHPTSAAESRALVVVDGGLARLAGWQRVLRRSLIARILTTVFDRGQTNAVLPSGTFATLAPRGDELAECMVRLRKALAHEELAAATDSGKLPAVRVWLEPLPSSAVYAERLLLDL